jgi:SAM-dependent methyltransferase
MQPQQQPNNVVSTGRAERDAAYYDSIYAWDRDGEGRFNSHPSQSYYCSIWMTGVTWIGDDQLIADLGCGPGQFAQLAIEHGKRYGIGIDFSAEAIELAKRRLPEHAGKFRVGDLHSADLDAALDCDAFVIFEVLEHIEDDLGLLSRIPSGRTLIFSVPSYDWESHVRCFPTAQVAADRYAPLLSSLEIATASGGDQQIFICRGVRR